MNKSILKHFGLAALMALGVQTAEAEAVAKIDTTEYESLAAAFAAANDGCTVDLLAGTHDMKSKDALATFGGKKVTLRGAGRDITAIDFGTGTKGCDSNLDITFENLTLNFKHDIADSTGSLVYNECLQHPKAQSFRNVKINGMFAMIDDATFDGCVFAGSADGERDAAKEYLVWNHAGVLTLKDCVFEKSGTKAPIKIYGESSYNCSLVITSTIFSEIGSKGCAIYSSNTNNGGNDLVYEITYSDCTVPEGKSLVTDSGKASTVTEAKPVAKNFYQDETNKTLWHVANVAGLKEFGAAVKAGSNFAGQTVVLDDDMDMSGVTDWEPISHVPGHTDSSFGGVFDGQDHVISNFTVQGDGGFAFFATLQGPATIKNVTFDHASVSGSVADKGNMVAIVVAYAYMDATFENIAIKDSMVWAFGKVGAIVGMAADSQGTTTFRNCKVENTTVKGAYNCGGLCGLVQNRVVVENCDVEGAAFVVGGRYPESAYFDLVTKATCGGETIDISGKFWKYDEKYYYAAWDKQCCYYPTQAECEWKLDGTECVVDANCLSGVKQTSAPETKVEVTEPIVAKDEEGKEITGDDAEAAQQTAEAAVAQVVANTGAIMTEGTGVEAAVFASDEEVKADVAQGLQTAAAVVTQDDKGVDLTKDEQDEVKAKVAEVATSKDVSSYVKIDVKSPVVKVEAAVATVKSLVFDVQPMAVSKITTTIDEANPKTVTVEAPVNYNDSAKPITFRLPLTDAFTVSAIVTHEGDPDRLCQVQGPAGSRYVEVSATHFSLFSVAPSDIVETTTESKTVLGIKRIDYTVTQKTADLAAAVPWLKAAGEDMPVAKLITTGLLAGDMIQVYDLEKKTYFSWHYDGTAWTSDALSTGGTSPSAETYPLKRGAAFWYKPAGAVSGTYTQVGLYSDMSAVTTKVSNVHADGVTQASFANPVHNLLASPKYEDFSVPVGLTAEKGCAKDDVVVVVATGARYRFDGSTWGQDVDREVTKFGVTVTQKAFAPIGAAGVGDGVVPAGTAFWYLSAGGAPEFAW